MALPVIPALPRCTSRDTPFLLANGMSQPLKLTLVSWLRDSVKTGWTSWPQEGLPEQGLPVINELDHNDCQIALLNLHFWNQGTCPCGLVQGSAHICRGLQCARTQAQDHISTSLPSPAGRFANVTPFGCTISTIL